MVLLKEEWPPPRVGKICFNSKEQRTKVQLILLKQTHQFRKLCCTSNCSQVSEIRPIQNVSRDISPKSISNSIGAQFG